MKSVEDQYKNYAVKIIYNETEGSGCLFQPCNENYSYVLTAKHCLLNSTSPFNSAEIKIYRFKEKEVSLNVIGIFFHEDLDIAIIQVEKVEELDCCLIENPTKDTDVNIYGYPHKINTNEEPRENIICKISFCHDESFEVLSDSVNFTFNTSVPENIIGLSGSGVFSEKQGILQVVGVFSKLKAPDGGYNKYVVFNLKPFDTLLSSHGLTLLTHTGISLINRDSDLLKKVFYLPYDNESEPYYLERTIDNTFKNLYDSPKHIWICGLSGVGKTNMVFRNLLQKANKFSFIDLSTVINKNIEEYFNYINDDIIAQHGITTESARQNIYERITENLKSICPDQGQIVIFVDEVPISENRKFNQFLDGFITISERFNNQPNKTNSVKWIISTRNDPLIHLHATEDVLNNKAKALKNFNFRKLDLWEVNDLNELLELIKKALNFILEPTSQTNVIDVSKGYPGRLKDVIDRMITENCSIEDAIKYIQSESC